MISRVLNKTRVLVLLITTWALATGLAGAQEYTTLTILHTNDTHTHLLPFSYAVEVGKSIDMDNHRDIGGIARRATLIKQIKAQHPNSTLVLDAGDLIDGSPFSIEFQGKADFAAVNAAHYDVVVTGNHEYTNTLAEFTKRQKEARFDMLGANVFHTNDGTPMLKPYVIKNENGLRVAILGLVTLPSYKWATDNVLVKDPIEVAREWVPKLRQQADVVIVLSHIGFDEDKKLAEAVPGIDAIIGGHSHTYLPQPVVVKNPFPRSPLAVGGTVITQDHQWGDRLGDLDLTFRKSDSKWVLVNYSEQFIPVTKAIPEDPEVRNTVEFYHRKNAAKYDKVLGEATADIVGEARMNLVADAMREAYNADFSVQNYGGARTDLVQGHITVADVGAFFPFGNQVLTFTITGKELKDLLYKSQPSVSNIKYVIDGYKLETAEIGGKPIDDNATYTGVTHSFYAGNSLPKTITTIDKGTTVRELIVKYIQSNKTITPNNELRAFVIPIPVN